MARVGSRGRQALAQTCDIAQIFARHAQTVYRVCWSYLGNAADAEDAVQSVFMKLVDNPRAFEDEEHEKAWLIVVAANLCKDVLKSAHRTRAAELPDDVADMRPDGPIDETLDAVLRLPSLYKDCVSLHYYEG